jgi:hypothetical protein
MKKLLLGMFSVVVLSAWAGAAGAAPLASCFRGDVMDSDGGHTGAIGAPKCPEQPSADSMAAVHGSGSTGGFYGEYNGHPAR